MNNAKVGLILSLLILGSSLIVASVVLEKKFFPSRHQTKLQLTPEQKEVLSALRNAQENIKKAHAELEQKQEEFRQLIREANTSRMAKSLDPNAITTWLFNGNFGNSNSFVVANGKPILWGFRSDGLITWKAQP